MRLHVIKFLIPVFLSFYSAPAVASKDDTATYEYTLGVSYEEVLLHLSNNNSDTLLLKALAEATNKFNSKGGDYITHFEAAWDDVKGEKTLANPKIFGTAANGKTGGIDPYKTTDAEVIGFLRVKVPEVISKIRTILNQRLSRIAIGEAVIEVSANIIHIKVKTAEDESMVKSLLLTRGSLEFWETYSNNEIAPLVVKADDILTKGLGGRPAKNKDYSPHPILSILILYTYKDFDDNEIFSPGASFGMLKLKDRLRFAELMALPAVRALFPADFDYKIAANPVKNSDSLYNVYALKGFGAAISGNCVVDTKSEEQLYSKGEFKVSMQMSGPCAPKWKKLTHDNIGNSIAIVVDGKVFTAPSVNSEISNGRSEISGRFTESETKSLAWVLQAETLPVDLILIKP